MSTQLRQIGLHHPRVNQIRGLLRNSSPQRGQLLVVEGRWAHEVLLDLSVPIEVFLWCPEASSGRGSNQLIRQLVECAAHTYQISARVLARIAERDSPDGLVSVVRLPAWNADTVPLADRALVLVADGIEIPGNLGTLLRSLDACAADCLVLTNRRTRLSHPKVFRGSRGMSLRVPVVEFAEPDDAAAWLVANGFTVCLATTSDTAVPYRELVYPDRTAFVVGNERYGISRPWRAHGFMEVCVPMLGAADSLNVSVCASILLYEARGQHQRPRATST